MAELGSETVLHSKVIVCLVSLFIVNLKKNNASNVDTLPTETVSVSRTIPTIKKITKLLGKEGGTKVGGRMRMNDVLQVLRDSQRRMMELISYIKSQRPRCPSSIDGTHTMIEYRSESKKVCIDCGYEEDLKVKWR